MKSKPSSRSWSLWPIVAIGVLLPFGAAARDLRVVATLPDLGSLVRSLGGDDVSVTVLAKGPQDPHFVEARPSFIQKLHRADLFVVNGMDLEIGWVPALLRTARNPDIAPGGAGYLDASRAIAPMEVPTTRVDRSMGDVHPFGNPHYLTDPVNGLRVAELILRKLKELRPEHADDFAARGAAFREALVRALVGDDLVTLHGAAALGMHLESGDLGAFLAKAGGSSAVGGWLGDLSPHRGALAVQDHRLWPYFARRFGLVLVDTLEPRPGIAPTTRHLTEVVGRMQSDEVRIVLSSPYIDARHAEWVAEKTGAKVVRMSHQTGGRSGTDGYIQTVGYNVQQLLANL